MWDNFIDYLQHLPNIVWNLIIIAFAIAVGLLLKWILSLIVHRATRNTDYSLIRSIISRLAVPINWFLPLFVLNLLRNELRMRHAQLEVFDKFAQVLMTLAVCFILIAIVKVAEDYVTHKYDLKKSDNLRERKVRTQLQFIRRFVIGVIVFITLCLIFLSFDNLRKLGAGLLTGVGIGGIIIGFAAQRSLANFLAGFQIAFTQPLRLDDVVIVEGEYGRVEEITLTYVVVVIWDERRLVLPINYFIEKPFQNWTRTGSNILSAAMLYLDYTVPVEEIRKEFMDFVQKQTLWDKRVAGLQVTDLKPTHVELRCLISANNSSHSFDLRCAIREHLLSYIRQNYPHALPRTRVELEEPFAKKDGAAPMQPS